jgi:hypothetical protein
LNTKGITIEDVFTIKKKNRRNRKRSVNWSFLFTSISLIFIMS